MPFLTLRSKKVYYEELGQQHFDTSIIFIHGGGGNHHIWMDQINSLSAHNHVFALDLPGHGQSEGPACVSIQEYADWICEFISHYLKGKKVIIVGHSMGGAISQQIAVDGFDPIKGVVLISTGAKLEIPPDFLEEVRKGEISQKSFLASFSPKTSESVHQTIGSYLAQTPMESTIRDFEVLNQYDLSRLLGKIKVPTLIIVGEDDVLTPPELSRFLHKSIANSKLTIVPSAGHYVVNEQPEAFQEHVQSFLNKLT